MRCVWEVRRGESVLRFVQSFCPELGVTLVSYVADERAASGTGAGRTAPVPACARTVACGVLRHRGASICPRGSTGAAVFEHLHLETHGISI